MRNLILFLLILVQSIAVHAANIGDDTVNIGQKGSTGDKFLIFRDANSSQFGVDHTSGDLSWTGNNFTLGDGTSGDKKFLFDVGLGANNPFYFWNSTKSKLGFSNDGTSIKDIGSGSGSGGGENFNNGFTAEDNANAEDGTSGWTASAGDFFVTSSVADWVTATSYSIGDKVVESGIIYKANTAHTSGTFASDIANWDVVVNADALEGDASFVWIPAAQNDTLTSPVLDFNKDILKGKSCQSLIEYIGGDENLSLKVLDANSNELDSTTLQAHGVSSTESGFFLCPSAADISGDSNKGSLRFRLENTGASASAAIKFDKNYLGTLIGLTETTTPDTFGGDIGSTGGLSNDYGDVISGTSDGGTGILNVTFSGLTASPSCAVQVRSGSDGYAVINSVSNTAMEINTYINTGALTESSVTISCVKRGSDAKQQVQVYKSIPKVSQNINEYSASFEGNTVCTKNWESMDVGVTCSYNSTGSYTINYTSLGLTVPPVIICTTHDAGGVRAFCHTDSYAGMSNTQSTMLTRRGDTAVLSDNDFQIHIIKQGPDYKLPVVQPVIVGQVQNSYASESNKNVATESCWIQHPGTPQFGSGDNSCDKWIDSIDDNGAGDTDLNFKTGIFSEQPRCVCTTRSVTNNSCSNVTSSTDVNVRTFNANTGGALNSGFNIICQGAR